MLNIAMNLDRSIDIDKPIEQVFSLVADFNQWKPWSPWLIQEPDCPMNIELSAAEIGHFQEWNGLSIGSGKMTLMAIEHNQQLDYELLFFRPWKSQSKVTFEFVELSDNQTRVIWRMKGSMPFFMYFMRDKMISFVGSDYERGLSMLKELLETGQVASALTVVGDVVCNGVFFVGKRRSISTTEVGEAMHEDFDAIERLRKKGKIPEPLYSFSIYYDYDIMNKRCEYTSGFAYENEIDIPENSGLIAGYLPKHKAMRIDHIGAYRNLGNAWTALQSLVMENKKKRSDSVPMYEIYRTTPPEVEETQIKTELYIAVI